MHADGAQRTANARALFRCGEPHDARGWLVSLAAHERHIRFQARSSVFVGQVPLIACEGMCRQKSVILRMCISRSRNRLGRRIRDRHWSEEMDSERFDEVVRAWTAGAPRRTVLGLLAGSLVGLAGLEESVARKKRRRRKPKPGSPPASPAASPPPPPAVDVCANGIKDGDETDIDCGGRCDKCSVNRQCIVDADCFTANCRNGKCTACQFDADCPAGCFCGAEANCYNKDESAAKNVAGANCDVCPPRTSTCFSLSPGLIRCRPFCGETYPD